MSIPTTPSNWPSTQSWRRIAYRSAPTKWKCVDRTVRWHPDGNGLEDSDSRLCTCHHRTQVQAWLRLAGHEPVPAIYGPSGDVKWDEADPTYSLEAAKRGG